MDRRPFFVHFPLFVALVLAVQASGQSGAESTVLRIGDHSIVRFFFDPGNYFHAPILFQAVDNGDKRLNTAPMRSEGRTVYITPKEMASLLSGLPNLGLKWKLTKEQEKLGDATKIIPDYAMVITIVSSKGTARAGFDPAKICETLATLDRAFTTPRAVWEFQLFRAEYGCKVPGLDGQKYQDHWPWSR